MSNTRIIKGLVALSLAAAGIAHAESSFQSTTTRTDPLTATAKVDFQITIPKVLFLRVGTGTDYTTVATVDKITFTPTIAESSTGLGTAVDATATSGDLGNGAVTAMVRGNYGDITLKATTLGPLTSDTAETIAWSEIDTISSRLGASTNTQLAAPVLANGASADVTLTAVHKVVAQDAKWTYKYKNTNLVAAGDYGGVNANNSRVTYTATLP